MSKKRFTDCDKWDDPWFMELSPVAKLLWFYLLDRCDNSGVIAFNSRLAKFQTGAEINSGHFKELGDRIETLPVGKLWITKFIQFQYGELKPDCRPHASVIELIRKHGIKGYPKGINTIKEQDKDKDTETEQEKEGGMQGGKYHKDSRTALHLLNEGSGRRFRETADNLAFISARLSEPEVTIDGVRLMIARQCKKWKGTDMEDYLRPETLFNKTKFDGYYAAKDLSANGKGSVDAKEIKEHISIRTI